MKVIRCDRCRKELAATADTNIGIKDIPDWTPITIGGMPLSGSGSKMFDLCSGCAKAAERFLTTYPGESA